MRARRAWRAAGAVLVAFVAAAAAAGCGGSSDSASSRQGTQTTQSGTRAQTEPLGGAQSGAGRNATQTTETSGRTDDAADDRSAESPSEVDGEEKSGGGVKSPEPAKEQDGGDDEKGDEEPGRTEVGLSAGNGRISPGSVTVAAYIPVVLVLRSTDGTDHVVRVEAGGQEHGLFAPSSGEPVSVTIPGLKPGTYAIVDEGGGSASLVVSESAGGP